MSKSIVRQQELGKMIASDTSSKAPNIDHHITGNLVELVWKSYVAKTTTEILERVKIMEEKGTTTISVSRQDHFHVYVQ